MSLYLPVLMRIVDRDELTVHHTSMTPASGRLAHDLSPRLLRSLMRLPLWLYRAHLGWLLGQRFLRLTHTGRRTGVPRQTVLEVVAHDRPSDSYVVVSGLGERAQWFRNVQETPDVVIAVGRRELPARAVRLDAADAAPIMRDYLRRHPLAFRLLARLFLGWHVSSTAADARRLAQRFPLVALRPRCQSEPSAAMER
jgi:deazaflavin-dependent oxidoreductase (nitroreductase family)